MEENSSTVTPLGAELRPLADIVTPVPPRNSVGKVPSLRKCPNEEAVATLPSELQRHIKVLRESRPSLTYERIE